MAMNTVINTNMMALTSHRNLAAVGSKQQKANQRLSSGKKINSAADDAAGLAISEKMKAQIKGLDMASKNSEDAVSLIQTAEGSLTEVSNMLTRVRELTVQGANDTNQKEDRVKIAEEVATLLTEIDSISSRTEFNEKKLNDGSFQDGHFQIGANSGQKLDLSIGNMSVSGIGIDGIMDAFGIEKSVDTTATAEGGITIEEPVMAKHDGAAIAGKVTADPGGTAKYTVEVTGADGSTSSITVDVELAKDDEKKGIADKVIAELEKEIGDKFTMTSDANGKITFEGKEAGVKVSKTGFDAGTATGATTAAEAATTQVTAGTLGKIDVSKAQDGDTVTIAGKTFTKVADANAAGETYGGFHDQASLNALLESEGFTMAADGTVNAFDAKASSLSGEYSVNEENVSAKGEDYSKVLDTIDESLKSVTTQRAKLGANQNRLEYTKNNLNLSSENLTAAKSRIEDTDMAKEMMNLTSANVLQQAATSMLAQANQAPQSITQLLG